VRVRELGNRPAPASVRDLIARLVRGRAPAIRIERRQIPYWLERGWQRSGNAYDGRYQSPHVAFVGHVVEHGRNHIDFYLYAPSPEIQRHSHWACFQDRGEGWYQVHMSRRPADVSSGIITIERLITEAYRK